MLPIYSIYSQTWLESHCLQHQPLYNNTHGRNGFSGLCTKCPGYNNNLVITAHYSGTKGVVVNKFDCTYIWVPTLLLQVHFRDIATIVSPYLGCCQKGKKSMISLFEANPQIYLTKPKTLFLKYCVIHKHKCFSCAALTTAYPHHINCKFHKLYLMNTFSIFIGSYNQES